MTPGFFLLDSSRLVDLLLPGGGARAATESHRPRLRSSERDGPGPPGCLSVGLDRRGMQDLYAAERAFASLNFPTTASTEVPKSSEGETWASRRKAFSSSPMPAKFTHRCLSVATMVANDRQIAAAVCLVARRARCVVRRNSATAPGVKP
ncbi:hypothetical protein PO909_031686 [Leuciscus waleckii]